MNRLQKTKILLHIRQVPVSRSRSSPGFLSHYGEVQTTNDSFHVRFQMSHLPTIRRYKNHASEEAGTQRMKHAALLWAGDKEWIIELILSCSRCLVRTLLDMNDISAIDYITIFRRCIILKNFISLLFCVKCRQLG
jgi:hypothetical protein